MHSFTLWSAPPAQLSRCLHFIALSIAAILMACGEHTATTHDARAPDDVARSDLGAIADEDGGVEDPLVEPDDAGATVSCSVSAARVLILNGGSIDRQHVFAQRTRLLLRAHRIAYEARGLDEEIAYEVEGQGQYAAILINDYGGYEALPQPRREALDSYAERCDVGLYFLRVPAGSSLVDGAVASGALTAIDDARVEASSPLLDLTRDGGTFEGAIPGRARLFELEPGCGFAPVAWTTTADGRAAPWMVAGSSRRGVRHVLNGHDFEPFFLDELLLVDALAWLSPVDLGALRERYVGVDIDDVFMPAHHDDPAHRTVKMQAADVAALIETQARISDILGEDFRFALGFCAGYYGKQLGDPAHFDDAAGDVALVEARASFYWFDHLWRHTIITDQPFEEIADMLALGRAWAEQTGVIEHVGHYAVTPQHSGTSQRYTPLYEAWREVWDVRYASDTSGAGDGFEHLGVLVAPRARAEIWSSQYSFDDVSRESLRKLARGGPVYRAIVSGPVTIFMTHQSNYARDRIGNYMFEEAFEFLRDWTHYEVKTGTPDELVQKHFELVPLETE